MFVGAVPNENSVLALRGTKVRAAERVETVSQVARSGIIIIILSNSVGLFCRLPAE